MTKNLLQIPDWASTAIAAKLKEAVSGKPSKIIGTSLDFPQWRGLTRAQRQDLLDRGFIPDVDRMGKPRIKVSQQARIDVLRATVMAKVKAKRTQS